MRCIFITAPHFCSFYIHIHIPTYISSLVLKCQLNMPRLRSLAKTNCMHNKFSEIPQRKWKRKVFWKFRHSAYHRNANAPSTNNQLQERRELSFIGNSDKWLLLFIRCNTGPVLYRVMPHAKEVSLAFS